MLKKRVLIVFALCFSLESYAQVDGASVSLNAENTTESVVATELTETTGAVDKTDGAVDAARETSGAGEGTGESFDDVGGAIDEIDEGAGASDETSVSSDDTKASDKSSTQSNKAPRIKIPAKKRPKAPDAEKLQAAQMRDDGNEEFNENQTALKFGTSSEISSAIAKITENEDPRYNDALYDLFYKSNSNDIKNKVLDYFAKIKDPCLEDYAVEILDDPYDAQLETVEKCLSYVSVVECKEAAPALVKLLETDEEKYFIPALSALGKTGGGEEAKYLAAYLHRDDLTQSQRQALMRALGQMRADETWDEIVRIAEDDDENAFVRMYAAEALGNMKKEEGISILTRLFEEGDPNMRQYCIKGLSNFSSSEKAKSVILQGIRDDHYKVRLEAIKACREMKILEADEFIIYRAKNDKETVVKKECYVALSDLNTDASIDFLIEQVTDKKTGEDVKNMACEALLKAGSRGEDEIAALAKSVVNDDRRKPLRQNLGKLIIKYPRQSFAEVCALYLSSKDTTTQSQGIEMYKSGRYDSAKEALRAIAESKGSKNALKPRAKKLLGIEDDEQE